jgi:hypothetical protein
MKSTLSFICGAVITVLIGIFAFSANKIALVSYMEYSGDGPSYLYSGQIDPKCSMTTYTTMNSVHRSIVAYSVYTADQVAGGATITNHGNQKPEVIFWDDGGHSMNNQFHAIAPVLQKTVSKSNNSAIACLGEAKVDKLNW